MTKGYKRVMVFDSPKDAETFFDIIDAWDNGGIENGGQYGTTESSFSMSSVEEVELPEIDQKAQLRRRYNAVRTARDDVSILHNRLNRDLCSLFSTLGSINHFLVRLDTFRQDIHDELAALEEETINMTGI